MIDTLAAIWNWYILRLSCNPTWTDRLTVQYGSERCLCIYLTKIKYVKNCKRFPPKTTYIRKCKRKFTFMIWISILTVTAMTFDQISISIISILYPLCSHSVKYLSEAFSLRKGKKLHKCVCPFLALSSFPFTGKLKISRLICG